MFTGSSFKINYIYQVLLKGGFQSSPGCFEIHWVRHYLINLMGLVGIVNTTVYKTEPIFTGLRLWWIVLIFNNNILTYACSQNLHDDTSIISILIYSMHICRNLGNSLMSWIVVNIGPGTDSMPLPDPMLTCHTEILWHSPRIISQKCTATMQLKSSFKKKVTSPRSQWVNSWAWDSHMCNLDNLDCM